MTLYTDIDPYCGAVLEERAADGRMPAGDVLVADVRSLTPAQLAPYSHVHVFAGIGGSPLGFALAGWPEWLSLVTGGFPCQDVSSAGKEAGLDGARSGLYREMIRVVEIKRPVGVLGENVGALSARGLERVARDLESLGYLVTVLRVGAWAVGAPDQRERWWFVCRRADAGRLDLGHVDGGRCAGARVPVRPGRQVQATGHAGGADAIGGMGDEPRRRGREHESGRGSDRGGVADGPTAIGGVADQPLVGCEPRAGGAGHEVGAGSGRDLAGRSGEADQLADLGVRGRGAERVSGEGSDPDIAGPGVGVVHRLRSGLEGQHVAESQLSVSCDAGSYRWPHPRWSVRGPDGIDRTVPTPQYDWEPPRLYPGTRTVNARWRLALMGYPIDWLDMPEDRLRTLAPKARDLGRWWNKQGVVATGNAQNCRVVAVIAGAMRDAIEGAAP